MICIKAIMDINKNNCDTCAYLGSDGDGPEYNGTWPICDKIDRMSNLKSFPFKKDMKCWHPEFWHSIFSEMIVNGTDDEMEKSAKAFCFGLFVAGYHSKHTTHALN